MDQWILASSTLFTRDLLQVKCEGTEPSHLSKWAVKSLSKRQSIKMTKLWFLVWMIAVLAAGPVGAKRTSSNGSSNKLTADDFLVTGLEEIEPAFATFQGQMHAGLLSITENIEEDNGKLMFWMFEPDKPKVDDSLVIWMNGGPGCSSFHAGLFLEMAPVTVPLQPAGSFGQQEFVQKEFNEYAWTNVTTVMYVEQPVGTGFSYGADPPEDEQALSQDFYNFLQNFNSVFPEHAKKRLYLVGESVRTIERERMRDLCGVLFYCASQNVSLMHSHLFFSDLSVCRVLRSFDCSLHLLEEQGQVQQAH